MDVFLNYIYIIICQLYSVLYLVHNHGNIFNSVKKEVTNCGTCKLVKLIKEEFAKSIIQLAQTLE